MSSGCFWNGGLRGLFQVWSKVCWYQLGFFSLSGFHSAWLWVQYLMSDKYQFMWKCNLDGKLCDFNIHNPFLFLESFPFYSLWKKNQIICSCKSVIWKLPYFHIHLHSIFSLPAETWQEGWKYIKITEIFQDNRNISR